MARADILWLDPSCFVVVAGSIVAMDLSKDLYYKFIGPDIAAPLVIVKAIDDPLYGKLCALLYAQSGV